MSVHSGGPFARSVPDVLAGEPRNLNAMASSAVGLPTFAGKSAVCRGMIVRGSDVQRRTSGGLNFVKHNFGGNYGFQARRRAMVVPPPNAGEVWLDPMRDAVERLLGDASDLSLVSVKDAVERALRDASDVSLDSVKDTVERLVVDAQNVSIGSVKDAVERLVENAGNLSLDPVPDAVERLASDAGNVLSSDSVADAVQRAVVGAGNVSSDPMADAVQRAVVDAGNASLDSVKDAAERVVVDAENVSLDSVKEAVERMVADAGSIAESGNLDVVWPQINSLYAGAIAATSEEERLRFLLLVAVALLYFTAKPGILTGAFDAYVIAPLQFIWDGAQGRRSWNCSDFVVGEWIGEGSFGIVYTGALLPRNSNVEREIGRRTPRIEELVGDSRFQKVILKKVKARVQGAEECAEMEEWFNYRMRRAAPDACAEYLGSFVADMTRGQFVEGGKWLVWKYEGELTLAYLMKQQDFPRNLEVPLFGKALSEETDPVRRQGLVIQKLMRQLLTSITKVHSSGVVHRDIKPSNLVVTQSGRMKIIDFGAATDLRIGKNFVPDRGMLDPDYCPPELYVMPEETPKPPSEPVAAILSPLVWQFNRPDLFDTYSVGIIFLQIACRALRTPIGLQTFKSEIAKASYDLAAWRSSTKMKVNFEALDLDGGRGWDLATKLVRRRGAFRRGRLSAAGALRHPYFLFGQDQVATLLSKIT